MSEPAVELEAMLERNIGAAIAAAYTSLRCEQTALDAAQVAAVKAAHEFKTGAPEAYFRARLIMYAHDEASRLLRSAMRRKRREQIAMEISRHSEVEMPDGRAERTELLDAISDEFNGLAPDSRHALSLRYLHELPLADVAAGIGISVEACKKRVSRGREELRRRLAARGLALSSIALLSLLRENQATAEHFAGNVHSTIRTEIVKRALRGRTHSGAIVRYGAAAALIFGFLLGHWIFTRQPALTAAHAVVKPRVVLSPTPPVTTDAPRTQNVNGVERGGKSVSEIASPAVADQGPEQASHEKPAALDPSLGLAKDEAEAAVRDVISTQIRNAPAECEPCGRD